MIAYFVATDADGRITERYSASAQYAERLSIEGAVRVAEPPPAEATHFIDGEFFTRPEQPALTYAQKRVREYPPIAEYIDAVVKEDSEQLRAYIEACREVKRKHPKEAPC